MAKQVLTRNKDINKLIRSLLSEGWSILQCKSGHIKLFLPNGTLATVVSSSPSDWRAYVKIKMDVHRAKQRR